MIINPYRYAGAEVGTRPFVNASLVSEFTDGAPGTISLIPLGLRVNDYVIVAHAVGAGANRNMSNSSGWAELTELWGEGATGPDANLAIYHKRMGATPDTSIAIDTTNIADGGAVVIFAVRGVNETTAFDVTSTTATGTSGNTQAASITPTTQNSLIVVAGCTAGSPLGDYATPADLANFKEGRGVDNISGAGGMGTYDWVSGTFTPNAWTATNAVGWAAVTMALRPRFLVSSDTRTTTGGDTRVTTGGDVRISEVYA